jgi:hypothetical protein
MVPQVESLPIPVGSGGDTLTQDDVIMHEHWCALFDTACPVPGGMAVHPDCLRLVLESTTKEAVTNYFEQLQKNRKKSASKALASLKKILDKVK